MNEEMEQEAVCELAELYVLDALTGDEIEKFKAHAAECEECRKLVSEYRIVMDLLPLASPPVEPPPGMKARILSWMIQPEAPVQVEIPVEKEPVKTVPVQLEAKASAKTKTESRAVPPRRIPIWRYVSLGLAAAVLGLIIYSGQLRGDVNQLQEQITSGSASAQALKVEESAALSPGAGASAASGVATIVKSSSGTHLVVQAENLPELTGTEVYQVWLMQGDKPQNAGTFVSLDGNGALYYSFQPQAYDTVTVTLEPDAGGDTPRGQIVLTAAIKQN